MEQILPGHDESAHAERRRVLIITSSYRPAMIADMHRARHLAWVLPQVQWDVEILCPDDSYQLNVCLEPDSDSFFAPHTIVHYVSAYLPGVFNCLRMRSIGWRALVPLAKSLRNLLKAKQYDVIYISTASFPLFLLGLFGRQYKVPFVLDFHDPCYKEGAGHPVWANRSLKHQLVHLLMKHLERSVVISASGIISVSPSYLVTLMRRYAHRNPPWLAPNRRAVIPFAVLPRDVDCQKHVMAAHNARPGETRIVYVGVGGPIMVRSFSLLCSTLAILRQQGDPLIENLTIELYGTMLGWPEGSPKHLTQAAETFGVDDLIKERPGRVSFRRSLELLEQSSGVLIIGVDDPGYMPSKLFTYGYSRKPLLAMLHVDGPAFAFFRSNPGFGSVLWFDRDREMSRDHAVSSLKQFLAEAKAGQAYDRTAALARHLAPEMGREHAAVFNACIR
jgi:hypothetical protein